MLSLTCIYIVWRMWPDTHVARWPSGLRRQTKDQDTLVSSTFHIWNLVFRGVGSNPTLVIFELNLGADDNGCRLVLGQCLMMIQK